MSDWYISLWTADAKVLIQHNAGVHVVSEGARGAHIQGAWCLGQREVVIAAHKACIRELLL
jgi:hypothetical protein